MTQTPTRGLDEVSFQRGVSIPLNGRLSNIGSTSATISWLTDRSVSSLVEFGRNLAYDGVMFDSALVTTHRVILTGLSRGTTYHYRILSTVSTNPTPTTNDLAFTTAP